jgi:phage baseplate assembly protein V
MSTIDRIGHRVNGLLVKGLIKGVTDSGDLQLVKIETLSGEVQGGIERLQPYGITTSPPIGSEVVAGHLNGNKDHGVVLVADSGAYRVTGLGAGEVAIYSQHGQKILLKTGGAVEITAPGGVSVGAGSDAVALAAKVDVLWATFYSMFSTWVPAPQDGGSALKAAFTAAFASPPASVASTNLKAD